MTLPASLVLILCAFSLNACAVLSTNPAEEPDVSTVSYKRLGQLAAERFGKEAAVIYLPNEPANYILVQQRIGKTAARPIPVTNYFVYEPKRDRVVLEEQGLAGTVAWQNNNHLLIRPTPGIIQQGDEGASQTSYVVDVRTGNRRGAGE